MWYKVFNIVGNILAKALTSHQPNISYQKWVSYCGVLNQKEVTIVDPTLSYAWALFAQWSCLRLVLNIYNYFKWLISMACAFLTCPIRIVHFFEKKLHRIRMYL